MRILHTSDWHLGRTFHGQVLDEAHAAFADHLVDLVSSESVDAVLVSGDVYDRAVPPASAVSLLDQTLRRLTEHTRVVLTPGNHDSAHRLGFAAELMSQRLVIRARTRDVGQGLVLPDAQGRDAVIVHALPYLDPDTARESLPHLLAERLGERGGQGDTVEEGSEGTSGTDSADGNADGNADCSADSSDGSGGPDSEDADRTRSPLDPPARLARSHEAVVGAALRLVAADLERLRSGRAQRLPSVVMAHAFVVGGRASESERDIRVGGVDAVPSQIFTDLGGSPLAQACGGLDYAALGHLHRPQEVRCPSGDTAEGPDAGTTTGGSGGPRLVYPGSPLALSFDEVADAGRPAGSQPAESPGTGPAVEPSGKSSVLLDLGPHGVRSLERVPVPALHRVVTVEGTMDHLLSPGTDHASAPGCWVRVVLRGERPPGALATLRRRFPGLLALRHEPPERERREQLAVTTATDPVKVATRFLDDVGGRPPEDAERAVLRRAYEECLAADRSRA